MRTPAGSVSQRIPGGVRLVPRGSRQGVLAAQTELARRYEG
jgi:hypothetical protein